MRVEAERSTVCRPEGLTIFKPTGPARWGVALTTTKGTPRHTAPVLVERRAGANGIPMVRTACFEVGRPPRIDRFS